MQPTPSSVLSTINSELIRQKFGTYGVDVLYHSNNVRLSNLYSQHDTNKITRTIALVQFSAHSTERFEHEHQRILQGASIGAIFLGAGCSIRKLLRAVYQLSISQRPTQAPLESQDPRTAVA